MALIFSHPTGNANVRAVASGLLKERMLHEFYTSIATFPGDLIDQLSSVKPFSEIRRRRFDQDLKPYTRTAPWRELGRLAATRSGLYRLIAHEKGPFCIDAVYSSLDKAVAGRLRKTNGQGVKAIYAYEDGAEFSFMEAKKHPIKCFYDLPTGYWRAAKRLLEAERELRPEWASTMTGFSDSLKKLDRKDNELRLANCIFVASNFVAETLKEYPGQLAPIEVIPYGFPSVAENRTYRRFSGKQPLKVLFVGKLTQQKGVAVLFDAAEKLRKFIQLTVVGHKAVDNCPALDAALSKHTWIPSLPHHRILELMREHDLLIFPSLFDGFGLVITEAMSQGTPVITTHRTAGPDLIEHGKNGWLVQAGSTDALIQAMVGCIERPDSIAEVGYQAMETAIKRPWVMYQIDLAAAIRRQLLV
ncbi:glycosyltransferase family 4 protein [Pontibacter sp. HSC-36F09]|uniref:glycosyltransferase family 4 protein n=1 Tax=Pontibacter sp. HSC-36F09 TaxID=2910966 RepID=UPI0020A04D38|nr:glycosyltransferase family 4 protein [Pontibacter sp. HSC-36F09]MCP2045726.1 glycosyltransferase involved in cell wall biosynthesis [Pontibacter sp. HSC-36F09]